MRHRSWSAASAVVVALALAACGDAGDAPAPTSATGAWVGTVGENGRAVMRLRMSQQGTRVSGRGSILAGSESLRITVSGTYAAPLLSLTISAQGFEPMHLSGAVTEHAVSATLHGSGFESSAVTLARQ